MAHYERLEVVDGQLMRQVYLNSAIGNIQPTDCVIFADGRRTAGCSRQEFFNYVSLRQK